MSGTDSDDEEVTGPAVSEHDLDPELQALPPVDENKPGKKFRFQASMGHFTYSGHVEKQALLAFMVNLFKDGTGQVVNEYSICHETGSTGYEHTHCYIKWSAKLDVKNKRKFDYDGVHPNIRRVQTKAHRASVLKYHKKQDSETLANVEPQTTIQDCLEYFAQESDFGEVIINPSYAMFLSSRMPWAKAAHEAVWKKKDNPRKRIRSACDCKIWVANDYQDEDGEDLEEPQHHSKCQCTLRQWQKKVVSHVDKQNHRQITWVVDPKGNQGKSQLMRWLYRERGAFVCKGGRDADLSRGYKNEALIVCDFPRGKPKEYWPTNWLEGKKDGDVSSSKYSSTYGLSDVQCTVLCFSNELPDWTCYTHDRWDVIHLQDPTFEVTEDMCKPLVNAFGN